MTQLSPPFGAYARWRDAGGESDARILDEFHHRLDAAQRVLDAADAWERLPGWAECESFCPDETQALLEAVRNYREVMG
jgi:hypothetical protein